MRICILLHFVDQQRNLICLIGAVSSLSLSSQIRLLPATPFEQALESATPGKRRWRIAAAATAAFAFIAGALYWGSDYYPRRHTALMHQRAWSKFITADVLDDAVSIGAAIDGVVDKVNCEIGAIVRIDQVCATIDARAYQLLAERAKANLTTANRWVEKATDQFARARVSYERSLGRSTAAPAMERTQKVFEQRQREVVQAEVAANLARAALRTAQSDLQHTSILAPIDGTIINRTVEVGQTVAARRTEPLFRVVANPSVVKINLTFDARDANKLYVGESVLLNLESEQDSAFLGEVTQISLAKRVISLENYDIVITVRDPSARLQRGMSAMIRIAPAASRPERCLAGNNAH
ncbi:efflux RND transporter periplasmic adaptor subunit [Methylocystis sp. B8]|nr:efflux RND transporter periplasmic adaptor subunit [Methylocystis sp. B8]